MLPKHIHIYIFCEVLLPSQFVLVYYLNIYMHIQLSHVHTYLCHDGINQLTLRQGEIGIMIGRQDVAEQQSHPYLSQGGHVGAHDSHSPPCSSSGKILPRYA